jgi:HAD superfamily hydrolase (TIGR01549 family)
VTSDQVFVDDTAALRRILDRSDALLLDFDGPICSVFAGFPAPVVAAQLREVLGEGGFTDLPHAVRRSSNPFDVLDFAATLGRAERDFVEAALTAHEVEAIASAKPTSSSEELIRRWSDSGRLLAIVSNNSKVAVETYLQSRNLMEHVALVSARSTSDPSLLKPDAYLLNEALRSLAVSPSDCAFVGDSESDIVAAQRASIAAIGYANKAGKEELFKRLNPVIIFRDMRLMVDSLPVGM